MVDIFAKEKIEFKPLGKPAGTDIFAAQGFRAPSISERNSNAVNSAIKMNAPKTVEQQQIVESVKGEQEQFELLARSRFTPEKIEELKANPIDTLSEGIDFLQHDQVLPGGGLFRGYDTLDVLHIAKKKSKGEELDVVEDEKLNKFVDRYLEQRLRGVKGWGGVAYYGSQMPAFMTEFVASGGVGKLAQGAIVKGAEEAATKAVVKKVAGVTANVAARTAVLPTIYVPKYAERRMNDFMAVTDKGQAVMRQSSESPAKSALLSYGYTASEVASEMSGGLIGKYALAPVKAAAGKLLNPLTGALRTPLIAAVNNVPVPIKDALYAAYKAINPNARVSKVFTAAGWNGMLEELGEERIADVMSATMAAGFNDRQAATDGKKFTASDYLDQITPSKDQLLIEAGIIAVAGGVKTSADMTLNLLKSKGVPHETAVEMADQMSANEQEQYVGQNLKGPVSKFPGLADRVGAVGSSLRNSAADIFATARQTGDVPASPHEAQAQEIVEFFKNAGTQRTFDASSPDSISRYFNIEKPVSVLQFIKAQGGLSFQMTDQELGNVVAAREDRGQSTSKAALASGELKAIFDGRKGLGRYMSDTGLGLDEMADALQAAGYIHQDEDPTPEAVLDIVRREVDGQKIYPTNVMELLHDNRDSTDANLSYLGSLGIDASSSVSDIAEILREKERRDLISDMGQEENIPFFMEDVRFMSEEEAYADAMPPSPVSMEAEISASQIAAVEQSEPPPINDDESIANKAYREWINELDPIQKLPHLARERGFNVPLMDSKLLSSLYAGTLGAIRQNLQVSTFQRNESGENVITGKSLKATLDDFDNYFLAIEPKRAKREQDFSDYLIAQRYLTDLKGRDDVEVSEAQIEKSVSDMARLSRKYGHEFQFFQTLGDEVHDFQKRILQNFVASGVMSQDKFDQIVKANPSYIPFDRVMEDKSFSGIVSSKGVFTNANANSIIKRIRGSDKEIKNVFHSVIKNTAKIIDISERNRVALSIANFAEALPEYIQKASAPMVKKGKAKIKVSYDKRLRASLEGAIEQLGGSIEREKTIRLKGGGYARGSYSPAENAIRLRIGSNEGTLSHEFGHMLDEQFDLEKKLLSDPDIKKELVAFAQERLSSETETVREGDQIKFREAVQEVGSEKYKKYLESNKEIIANFIDGYINSQQRVSATAPKAVAAFQGMIEADKRMSFIKDITPSLERGEEEIEQDVWGESEFAPQGTITVKRNGVREYYKVAKPILAAVESLSPSELNIIEKIFTASASILRTGATLVPEFWVRNVLRDQHTALLQSGVKYTPKDFVRGLFAVLGKTDLYNEWERSGGSFNSFMELDDKGLERAYSELFRPDGRLMRYLKNPIRIAEDISGGLEKATRIGVFSAALDEGQSAAQAALTSRDATLDFSRRGALGKQVNRVIPFFNAGVQGSNKMIRTFRSNPKAVMMWGIATVTLPSVIIAGYYLYGAPDDEREEYLEIPQWQKDMFWVVKIGGEWRRYPKPFAFGYIFGSLPERVLHYAYEGEKPDGQNTWQDIVLGIGGAFSPIYDPSSLIPPIAKTAIEHVTNYNFFTGRNIFPDWMERLDPEFQSNKYSSESAKFLGEKFGMSPAKIDNALRGTLAGSAEYLTGAGDFILEKVKEWNGEEIPDQPITNSDIPLVKAFAVRRPSGYRSNSAAAFFEAWTEVQKKHASYGRLDGEEKTSYFEKHKDTINQYRPMSDYQKQMKALQKEADAVYDDPKMGSEAKVKKINSLEDQITMIARTANRSYKKSVKAE